MLRSVFDEWKVNLKTTLPCNHHLDPWCVFFYSHDSKFIVFSICTCWWKNPRLTLRETRTAQSFFSLEPIRQFCDAFSFRCI